jgi:hypothetical protein
MKRNPSGNIPKYIGSVKTMIVAGDATLVKYGSAEKARSL